MEFAAFRELKTQRLVLRRLVPEDAAAYFARLTSCETVTRHMLWQSHRDISEATDSIQKVLRRYEEGRCYRWAIARKEDDSLIGIIDLLSFDEDQNSCSFAYMLGEDYWGQGYGTEALQEVFTFAFAEMQIGTILADHFTDNPASGAVMRKAGMHCTGILPKKYEKDGIWHDAAQYCITKEGWKRTRAQEDTPDDP